MAIACLDINDSNLQLWHGDKRLQSPGYALLEGGQYRFGSDARAAARLRPREVSTRYWWQLSTDPLQPALGPARHSADLVHAHLLELHSAAGHPGELLLAAPGSMRKEQLALLLGIIQQCPFDAVGLVNRSVALASLHAADGPLFHLEIQLHQALLSELRAENGNVTFQRATALPGSGLLQLQERVVEAAATAFIRQTRFDPRRRAETEQQLYDALPAALQQLQQSNETSLTVNGYHARIARADLEAASATLAGSVSSSLGQAGVTLLLDPLAALLPGLRERLAGTILHATDLPRALAAHEGLLVQRAEALDFVTSLPQLGERAAAAQAPAAPPPAAAAPAEAPRPTHLLLGNRARPLQADGTSLGGGWSLLQGSNEQWQLHAASGAGGLERNGQPARDSEAVASGDRLRLPDGADALLITVSA
ncbi:hypothetical protein Q6D67_13015 [Haliea sp. E1-2-M8]|uniref:hypothetical protein n=1 Tax=Haliea sp. E1-2-M8 TaxID=3064706 RepID=UPI002718CD94|nr:hypothetical protein [Haliea sp. E1-2-M8]MDO8862624.1 hypothetical protein [Haliea sp. E1-2-M8]